MTNYINEKNIRDEVAVFLKNEDVLSTSERGVTSIVGSSYGSLSSETSMTIERSNVRNIRRLSIADTSKTFGTDYTVDYYSSVAGTRKCVISLTSTTSGIATVTYDYGSVEKIYPNFPRTDMTLDNYPRVGLEIIDLNTDSYGFGNVNNSDIDISFTVVDDSKDNILDIMSRIRSAVVSNQNNFFYMKLVKPKRTGPVVPVTDEKVKNKLFTKSSDIRASFNIENNN